LHRENQVVIRLARPADATALARLRFALRASTGKVTEPENQFLTRCTAWMQKHLMETHAWQCWIAALDDQLIGCVWVQLVEKIPNPRHEPENHAYITNFYVDGAARNRGIGSQLLSAAIKWCETSQVHAVILWPTERSRSLYERHGFAVRDDIMELVLGR